MTNRLADLLERLQPVVREEMLKVSVPNNCIATVAVLCRVLKHYGFRGRGVPCSVTIRNAKMVKAMASGMAIPSDPEPLHAWMKATGSWAIGIMPESALLSEIGSIEGLGYKAFGGHLICNAQDALIDASLCQADRPQYQIELPRLIAMPAHGGFMRGESAMAGIVNGCEVIYQSLQDSSWRNAPDWVDERRYRSAVNAILERVREGQQASCRRA